MTEKLSLHDIGDKNLLLKIFPVLSWQGMKYDDCSSSVTAVESGQAGLQNLRNAEGGVQFSRRSGSSSSGQCQCK